MPKNNIRKLSAKEIRGFLKSKFVMKTDLPKLRMELMRRGLKVKRRRI